MQELKRLLSGFLASLMVLSLILSPIPNVNIAWAQDSSNCEENPESTAGRVYVVGCDLDKSMTQAKLDNVYGDDEYKWLKHVEQAIMAMTSLVLMENLFFKYQWAYDNKLYGDGCPDNRAAGKTIRIAQLASLSYIIGHIIAHAKFIEQAKTATDNAFEIKNKEEVPQADSEAVTQAQENGDPDPIAAAEQANDDQIAAYNALMDILIAQRQAVETKMSLDITASAFYGIAALYEGISTLKCAGVCAKTYGQVIGKYTQLSCHLNNVVGALSTGVNVSCSGAEQVTKIDEVNDSFDSDFLKQLEGLNSMANMNPEFAEDIMKDVDPEQLEKDAKDLEKAAADMPSGPAPLLAGPLMTEYIKAQSLTATKLLSVSACPGPTCDPVTAAACVKQSAALSIGIPACIASLKGITGQKIGRDAAEPGVLTGEGQAKQEERSLKDKLRDSQYLGWLFKIGDALTPDKVENNGDVPDEKLIEAQNAQDITDEQIAKEKASLAASKTLEVYDADITAITIAEQTCQSAIDAVEKIESACTPVSSQLQLSFNNVVSKIDTLYKSSFEAKWAKTQCCGFNGITVLEAPEYAGQLTSKASSYAAKMAGERQLLPDTVKAITEEVERLMKIPETYAAGEVVPTSKGKKINGTYQWEGFSPTSVVAKVKDIQPLKLFGDVFKKGEKSGAKLDQKMLNKTNLEGIEQLLASNDIGNIDVNALIKNEQQLLLKRPENGFTLEKMLPIVVANELYTNSLTNYVDWDSMDPKKIKLQIAHINKEISAASEKIKEAASELQNPKGPVIATFEQRYQEFGKIVKTILNNISFIQPAHAIDMNEGMVKAAVGVGLQMLGDQLGGAWSLAFGVPSKYLMLKGILQAIGVNEMFVKKRGRFWGYTFMSALAAGVAIYDSEVIKQIQKRLEVVASEKKRFNDSSAGRGRVGSGPGRGSNAGELKNYDFTTSRQAPTARKTCAAPKSGVDGLSGWAPEPCPTAVGSSHFEIPEVQNTIGSMLGPNAKNLSLLTSATQGAATGQGPHANGLSGNDLGKVEDLNNAIQAAVLDTMKKLDKMDAESGIPQSKRSRPLLETMAKFNRAFGNNKTSGSPLGSIGSSGGSAYNKGSSKLAALVPAKKNSLTKSAGIKMPDIPKSKGFDLDFGDDDSSTAASSYGMKAGASNKKQEKLDDFVIEHDDISKKKDVPIWKILSNRYILSYPKVLDEEDAKVEPDKVKKKKK